MESWGYGEGYRYPHEEDGFSADETYLPDALIGRSYYQPTDRGFESRIRERLRKLRAAATGRGDESGGPQEEKP